MAGSGGNQKPVARFKYFKDTAFILQFGLSLQKQHPLVLFLIVPETGRGTLPRRNNTFDPHAVARPKRLEQFRIPRKRRGAIVEKIAMHFNQLESSLIQKDPGLPFWQFAQEPLSVRQYNTPDSANRDMRRRGLEPLALLWITSKERLIKAQWGRARSAASRSSLAPLEPPPASKGFNQRFLKSNKQRH